MSTTGFAYHPDFLKHDTGDGHPERAERLVTLIEYLQAQPLYAHLHQLQPEPAEVSHIARVHPQRHIERIAAACRRGFNFLDTDTPVCEHSYQAALRASGALVAACDAVVRGQLTNAFCAVRPPGHHAEPERPMGFCLFNNVAVAAKYLQDAHDVDRICIIDWDVHHGNGTQAAFYKDPSVLFISLHQYPLYPGTGAGDETGSGFGLGFTTNFPLKSGSGDDTYVALLNGAVADKVLAFDPDFILLSAGFDAHTLDPLANMNVTEAGFAEMTGIVKTFAGECCQDRLVSTLEGGYHLDGLKKSVAEHLNILIN